MEFTCSHFNIYWTGANSYHSASPLNGEAAELWDKDPTLFKTKVMDRHKDIDDD